MSDMIKDPDMDGRCWHGDEEDGKMLFIDEAGTIRPSIYRGLAGERLYTAADMKAERIETVERCIAAVKREERADVEYLAQPANVVYNTAIEHCMRALHKLKEKINAS